jgi:hypothetical protein
VIGAGRRLAVLAATIAALPCSWASCYRQLEQGPCRGITCSDQGLCFAVGDNPYCECTAGWHPAGLDCEENDEANPCLGVTCDGHGTCDVEAGAPVCTCDPGYDAYGALHCIATGDVPDAGGAPDVRDAGPDLPGGAGVIDDLQVSPGEVEPGASVTVSVGVRGTGPGPLEDAVLVVDARSPGGASSAESIADIDLLPGGVRTLRQARGPLGEEGTWTFFARLEDADGDVVDPGPADGVRVTVRIPCDTSCVCAWFRPACVRSSLHPGGYVWSWHCWVSRCPHCGAPLSIGTDTADRYLNCTNDVTCGMHLCGICGGELTDPPGPHFATPCARPCPPVGSPP